MVDFRAHFRTLCSWILNEHCYNILNIYCITKRASRPFCDSVSAQYILAVYMCELKLSITSFVMETA